MADDKIKEISLFSRVVNFFTNVLRNSGYKEIPKSDQKDLDRHEEDPPREDEIDNFLYQETPSPSEDITKDLKQSNLKPGVFSKALEYMKALREHGFSSNSSKSTSTTSRSDKPRSSDKSRS